jgi:5'-nucleotidase
LIRILLTNDDGIESYGLWAAADALSALGEVTVVAPREQWSGAGRCLSQWTSGVIQERMHAFGGDLRTVYAVDASPAQSVLYALLEILPQKPDLVVAGVNYGENMGNGITISGTVGAVLEAASAGLPAMALSVQTPMEFHLSNSDRVDFSMAAYFGQYFARRILAGDFRGPDLAAIKVDVPSNATQTTPWKITRVSRQLYYIAQRPLRSQLSEPAGIPYSLQLEPNVEPDSDLHALLLDRVVSVTPLSLDLTARVDLAELDRRLHSSPPQPAQPSA